MDVRIWAPILCKVYEKNMTSCVWITSLILVKPTSIFSVLRLKHPSPEAYHQGVVPRCQVLNAWVGCRRITQINTWVLNSLGTQVSKIHLLETDSISLSKWFWCIVKFGHQGSYKLWCLELNLFSSYFLQAKRLKEPYKIYVIHSLFKRFYLFIFREGKGGRKRGRGTSRCGCLSHTPNWQCGPHPGMCPDWESNCRPFGSQASAQSTEPHHPGLM